MDVTGRHVLYRERVLSALPRLLTELDRDKFSFTHGSFDREYWAWATKDFSNADLQRGIYALTILYLTPFEGNRWHRMPRARDWILGAFEFWRRTQHRNGSHDHHYPNEYSFVGAAFPLYEIAESFRLLVSAGELDGGQQAIWVEAMKRSARFLCEVDELHGFISNHRIGAACALELLCQITGEAAFRKRAADLIHSVRSSASKTEGWPHEYGGADPGYQTLDTYYMANYLRLTRDEEFFRVFVSPSVNFIKYFFHPDGSVGGEYGSRNCSLYFPSGFEFLATRMPEAEAIAAVAADAIRQGDTPALADMDIRNFVPMLSSYAQAILLTATGRAVAPAAMPFTREFECFWPGAGLYVRSDKNHYVIVGCSKGGVVKVFEKASRRLIASSAGYMVRTDDGRVLSNQFLAAGDVKGVGDCAGRESEVRASRNVVIGHPFFQVIQDRTASQLKFLLFRLFTFTFGRVLWLANWVKRNVITGLFIHRRRRVDLAVTREISFRQDEVTITDEFDGNLLHRIASLRRGDVFTTIYMASSKYYRHQEAISDTVSQTELAGELRRGGRLTLRLIPERWE